jgi:hypothetical protein
MEPLQRVPFASDVLEYHQGTVLPHYLKRKGELAELIVPHDLAVGSGDTLEDEWGGEVMVIEILERRRARGDWSDNPFDREPDWVRVKIL